MFLFGSELKALRAHPRWEAAIDRRAVASLTRYGYIPAPSSIYENIYKLAPGCVLDFDRSPDPGPQHAKPGAVLVPADGCGRRGARPFKGTESEAEEQLRSLLLDSVRQQMVADVPLGAFLSGGIDSSLVVALMQAQSRRPIKTFSIGFRPDGFDEAPYAKSVASHLGTDHTELLRPAR